MQQKTINDIYFTIQQRISTDWIYKNIWNVQRYYRLKRNYWQIKRTKVEQTIFVSATPGPWELEQTKGEFIDQVIRPTGLIDPPVEIRPAKNQVDDLMHECKKKVEKNYIE